MKKCYFIIELIVMVFCLVSFGAGWKKATCYPKETYEECIPYIQIFQEQAPLLGWEWQTLAALAWNESHFNPYAHSYAGACGVMQLMPKTARRYGLDDETIWQPEANIKAGVQYLVLLEHKWAFISNDSERLKFVLASYNAGHGIVFKARRQAKEAGANPYRWSEVEPFMNQRTTKRYVNQVSQTANKYKQ